jgi:hypothetical protein
VKPRIVDSSRPRIVASCHNKPAIDVWIIDTSLVQRWPREGARSGVRSQIVKPNV